MKTSPEERNAPPHDSAGLRLEVVPFRREHLDILCPREAELHAFGLVGHDPDRAAALASQGPAYTLLAFWQGRDLEDDDGPGEAGNGQGLAGEVVTAVACGGIMLSPLAANGTCVGDAWALTGKAVDRMPVAFHRAVRQGLASIMAAHRLRRVQAVCLASHEQARRWLERLGFTRESREPGMAGVVPGERTHLYAIVPEDMGEETA